MINYRIGEHYYTASKFKNGFDTIDFSSFLSREEVNVIERLGLYKSAEGLSYSPSEDEIKDKFPINLAFYRIPSINNRFVYLHSNYTGKANHTPDRNGNYFSHSLILKDSEPLCPAVFIFNNYCFENKFTIEQDVSYQPHLNEKEITIDNDDLRVYRQYFIGFIEKIEKDSTINIFAKLIDLISEGKLTDKANRISICGENIKVKEIILALNFFLPQIIANKISFATYINDPLGTPFQLTGIIPECRISSLDLRYYTLIDATTDFEYLPKHEYTKFLIDIISEKSEKSYNKWSVFNRQLVGEFGITEATDKLNIPILYSNFINDPQSKTIEDFCSLISINLPLEKEFELRRITVEENPEVYLNFILIELAKITDDSSSSLSKKCASFISLFNQHLKNTSPLRPDLFLQFIEGFRDRFTGLENSKVSLFILSNLNCIELKLYNLDDVLQSADFYFEEESIGFEDKLKSIQSLDTYNLKDIDRDKIKYIMIYKKIDELKELAIKGSLYSQWDKYKTDLLNLKESDRITLLMLCFNPTFNKNKFHFTFQQQISIVEDILPENQPFFWKVLFEKNNSYNKEKSLKYYSLEYLKRKFVSYLFLKDCNKLKLISEFSYNESIVKWIQEDVTEQTTDEALVDKFNQTFNKYLVPPRKTWF